MESAETNNDGVAHVLQTAGLKPALWYSRGRYAQGDHGRRWTFGLKPDFASSGIRFDRVSLLVGYVPRADHLFVPGQPPTFTALVMGVQTQHRSLRGVRYLQQAS